MSLQRRRYRTVGKETLVEIEVPLDGGSKLVVHGVEDGWHPNSIVEIFDCTHDAVAKSPLVDGSEAMFTEYIVRGILQPYAWWLPGSYPNTRLDFDVSDLIKPPAEVSDLYLFTCEPDEQDTVLSAYVCCAKELVHGERIRLRKLLTDIGNTAGTANLHRLTGVIVVDSGEPDFVYYDDFKIMIDRWILSSAPRDISGETYGRVALQEVFTDVSSYYIGEVTENIINYDYLHKSTRRPGLMRPTGVVVCKEVIEIH